MDTIFEACYCLMCTFFELYFYENVTKKKIPTPKCLNKIQPNWRLKKKKRKRNSGISNTLHFVCECDTGFPAKGVPS